MIIKRQNVLGRKTFKLRSYIKVEKPKNVLYYTLVNSLHLFGTQFTSCIQLYILVMARSSIVDRIVVGHRLWSYNEYSNT